MIRSSLFLRFQNQDLGSLNQILEQQVNQRSDELKSSLALISSTLESINYGIVVIDLNHQVYYYNHQFLAMWHLQEFDHQHSTITSNLRKMLRQLTDPSLFIHGLAKMRQDQALEFHDELHLKDGRIFERQVKPHIVDKHIVGHVWSYRDITMHKRLEEHIVRQANYDSLTDLPNRSLLYDRIEHDIEVAKRHKTRLGIMFIDIDHFKDINDALGHHKGDVILQTIAKRLKQSIRKSDSVARFGGDEFILLFLCNPSQDITHFCEMVLRAISEPIMVDNEMIHTTASLGISFYPQDGIDSNTLIKHADMAMYIAKRSGRNHFQIYNANISHQAKRHYEIQQQLINALARGEFNLVYQPIVNLRTNKIMAAEALIRWRNPKLGVVPPSEFIPIAEDMGVIVPISKWIIEQACLQNKLWQLEQLPHIKISVNIASIDLKRNSFIEVIKHVLEVTELNPNALELELTETTLMESTEEIKDILKQLKRNGIEISIDDFGTGYSSFRYLTEFPATKLKIDRSLVLNCEQDPKHLSIIKAIVHMSHQLNLMVVAEGVETAVQYQLVKESNCDEVQGFYISKPLSPADFVEFLTHSFKEKEN